MDQKTIDAIMDALERGERVEITMKGGRVEVRTVHRKKLKIPTA